MTNRPLRTAVAAVLGLAALQASAQAPHAPRLNDETGWLYVAPAAGPAWQAGATGAFLAGVSRVDDEPRTPCPDQAARFTIDEDSSACRPAPPARYEVSS